MPANRTIPHCLTCERRAQGLFCAFKNSHMLKLDRKKVTKHYKRGQAIFYEGTPAAAIYCIYSGTVKLYKVGRDDQEVVIRLLRAGDIVGYRPLLAGELFSATAQVVEDTTVCTITKETFFDLIRQYPDLGMRLMSKLATELRVSEDQLVVRVLESVPQRTARFLVWFLDGSLAEATDRPSVDVPLRRDEMAQIIGTTPETLSRVLKDFKRRQIIDVDRRLMTVRKPLQLQSIADHGIS